MAIVEREVQELLKDKKHEYSQMSEDQLNKIVRAVSYQDAGNYDGKFVGMMASNELIYRSAKRTQWWTMAIAVGSLIVAIVSLGISIFKS